MNNQDQGFEMPSTFERQMEVLQEDMREMRSAVTEMAKAMSKLAVLEERNLATNLAIEKIIQKIDKMDGQAKAVELKQVAFEARADGISKTMRWMWGAFGGGVIYIGSQAIQFFASGMHVVAK